MVEFALALPIFLLLVFGLVDLGRGFFYYNMLANMTREGARYAIVDPNNTYGITTTVTNAAFMLDSSGPLNVSVATDSTGSPTARGHPITVTATYSMFALTPLIGQFIPNGLGLSSRSTMIIEGSY